MNVYVYECIDVCKCLYIYIVVDVYNLFCNRA